MPGRADQRRCSDATPPRIPGAGAVLPLRSDDQCISLADESSLPRPTAPSDAELDRFAKRPLHRAVRQLRTAPRTYAGEPLDGGPVLIVAARPGGLNSAEAGGHARTQAAARLL